MYYKSRKLLENFKFINRYSRTRKWTDLNLCKAPAVGFIYFIQ